MTDSHPIAIDIVNGSVLLPDGAAAACHLGLAEGRIAAVGRESGRRPRLVLEAGGMTVLPGIVDIHGDAFERQLMPRPGVRFAPEVALLDTDRQLAANGVTTAYHGLTVSWEPGLRSVASAEGFMEALAGVRSALACDTRVHLRFERFALDGVDPACRWLESGRVDLLALNDHMGSMRTKLGDPEALGEVVARTGLSRQAFERRLSAAWDRRDRVPEATIRLAKAAREAGVPMASHDDDCPETRRRFLEMGCGICEFPANAATARAAVADGGEIVLGAPNVLNGGSHCSRMAARQAVGDGLCSILSSDYYYPALFLAPLLLRREGVCGLSEAWSLVSRNPSRALGLGDRGEIREGFRADVVVADLRNPARPRVAATLVAGRLVWLSDSGLLQAR